jgi:glycosyltransferase involved in cell wall biosynthesis
MSGLHVAVPTARLEADPASGAGRVWTSVLERLRRRGVRITPREPRRPRLLRRRSRPDVWLAPGDVGALDVDEPVVAVVHGAAWPVEDSFHDYVPREFAEGMIAAVERTLPAAAAVIVPSEYTRRGLEAGYGLGADRVFVVPHGVDAQVFSPAARGGEALAEEAFDRPLPYVLFASIPSIQQKNLPALREAMGALAARGLPHGLVIAGGTAGGESAAELDAVGAELPGAPGRVAWLGHVDDARLAALMAGCDAFCLPSLFESFGLTALEAMACGAPVVVSDRGALPEVVADAALVTEPTAAALAAALERVLGDRDLAAKLGAAGRARAETMTWERTAEGWLAVLRRAAGFK